MPLTVEDRLGSLTDELLGLEKMKEDQVKRRICP
jgi:hypothetical protein